MSDLPDRIRIGDVILDRQHNQIRTKDAVQSIEPRLVRLLEELCLASGGPVPRAQLLEAVSSLPYAGDEALTQAISKARRILGDDTRQPRYIRTIPRKGYALVAPVSPWADDAVEGLVIGGHMIPWQRLGIFAAALLLLAALYMLLANREVEIELIEPGEQEFFEKQDLEGKEQDFREKESSIALAQ